MAKKVYGQKNVTVTHLQDYTQEEAKAKGKIFYTAWSEVEQKRIEKNREKLKKAFDKRQKK
jgi:hypothetical protein